MHHVDLLSTSTPEEQSEVRTELTAAIKAMVQRATKRLSDLPRGAGDLVGQAGGDGGL